MDLRDVFPMIHHYYANDSFSFLIFLTFLLTQITKAYRRGYPVKNDEDSSLEKRRTKKLISLNLILCIKADLQELLL